MKLDPKRDMKFDPEEQAILDAYEVGQLVEVRPTQEELEEMKVMAENTLKNKRGNR